MFEVISKLVKVSAAFFVISVASTVMTSQSAQAALITSGYNPSLLSDETVGARYRSQSTGNEHYVGINSLGEGSNREEAGFSWFNGVIPFEFSFNSVNGEIISTLNGNSISFTTFEGLFSDAVHLTLANRSKGDATFAITDLLINGELLGGLTCSNWCDWMVTDFAVLPMLTITGNINFEGTMNFNDSERVKLQITSSTVAQEVSEPGLIGLFALSLLGFGVARRRRTA